MGRANYTQEAKADLVEISAFYVYMADVQTSRKVLVELRQQARYLAETPLLDRPIEGLPAYRQWIYRKRQIKFYYRRLGAKSIRVYRIYSAKRKPLDLTEIAP